MIVAIHQPNYLPWLGYFAKIAQSDVFVFLDDVQFSKNSYTNRTRVLNHGEPHWLTVPVHARLGDAIDAVKPAKPNWARGHLDTLANFYRRAPAYKQVWPDIQALFADLPDVGIAESNAYLIENIARLMGLSCRFAKSSAIDTGQSDGDQRLAKIVTVMAPGGAYLSGEGARQYQNAATFEAAGIELRYSMFTHPIYVQGDEDFAPGLSAMDAVFSLGWAATGELIAASIR